MSMRNYGDVEEVKRIRAKRLLPLIHQLQRVRYAKRIKNILHVWFVFNAYNIRNFFTNSTSQWLYYKNADYKEISHAIVEKFKLTSHKKILDIGCGNGGLLRCFREINHSFLLHGVDINPLSLSLAKNNVPHGKFFKSSCDDLIFLEDSVIDCCIIFGVLNYLEIHQLGKTIDESIRITKDGGHIIILNNYEQRHHNKQNWGTYYLPDNYWENFTHENVCNVEYISMQEFCVDKKYEGNAVIISLKSA
jgi:ubiquinone/menaquinone biosynthesis C-methylase UbiE